MMPTDATDGDVKTALGTAVWSAFTQAAYHFVGITMNDKELSAEVIDRGGVVIDKFKVIR